MPRRREVPKREVLPDPKFGSVELSKFMNVIMEGGKKAVAERIIYGALEQMEKKSGKEPLELFITAINNVKPMVEVKSRRVGGANYQVPVECVLYVAWRCLCAGLKTLHANVVKNPCPCVWPTNCSKP